LFITRNRRSDRLRSLEIDHELEFRRLLDRHVLWTLTTKHPSDKARRLPVDVIEARAVAGESALLGAF
jgi:hypothetical protein